MPAAPHGRTLVPFGKYQVLEKIAAGGMAELFLAQQEGPGGFRKSLVIKRILPHLAEDPEFISMFLNEARLAALLNHPSIVSIFDLGQQDGSYFIAMEHIDGVNLRQLAQMLGKLKRPIDPRLAAAICARAADGLDYAHRFRDSATGKPLGIVHRDVSLENILVSRDGIVKLVDFGIAKAAAAQSMTRGRVLKGKYAYMAPEQVRGEPLDGQADIFSLGVVLYVLTTGAMPFTGENDGATLENVLNKEAMAPHLLRPGFPRDLERIILKALAKGRDQRFVAAADMAAALDTFTVARGGPVNAREVDAFLAGTLQDFRAWRSLNPPGSVGDRAVAVGELESPLPSEKEGWLLKAGLALVAGAAVVMAVMVLRVETGTTRKHRVVVEPILSPEKKGQATATATSKTTVAPPAATAIPSASVILKPTPAATAIPTASAILKPTPIATATASASVTPTARPSAPPPAKVTAPLKSHAVQRTVPAKPTAPALATFILSSEPAAQIEVDGKVLGETTPVTFELPAGANKVTFVNRPLGLRRTVEITARAGKRFEKSFRFGKGTALLDVPAGSGIYLDGRRLGAAPVPPQEIYEGEHALRVVNVATGLSKSLAFELAAGERKNISLK